MLFHAYDGGGTTRMSKQVAYEECIVAVDLRLAATLMIVVDVEMRKVIGIL